jgi:hypothetical protein
MSRWLRARRTLPGGCKIACSRYCVLGWSRATGSLFFRGRPGWKGRDEPVRKMSSVNGLRQRRPRRCASYFRLTGTPSGSGSLQPVCLQARGRARSKNCCWLCLFQLSLFPPFRSGKGGRGEVEMNTTLCFGCKTEVGHATSPAAREEARYNRAPEVDPCSVPSNRDARKRAVGEFSRGLRGGPDRLRQLRHLLPRDRDARGPI